MEQINSEPALVAKDIAWSFGKNEVLKGASFFANPGECVAIAGINGSGKSTLFSILAGIRKAKEGSFTCFGHDIFKEKKFAGKLIGYLPQTNPLLEELSVEDNLKLWSDTGTVNKHDLLNAFEIEGMLKKKVQKLSGGMKRRVAITCALMNDPSVMILDEPTASLDIHHKEVIHNYIKNYNSINGTVILSSHDPEELEICNRIFYLTDGCLEEKSLEDTIKTLKEEKS